MPRDKLPKKGAQAAKRPGELQESIDPGVPEWGNPVRVMSGHPMLNT
jgi:hypothetical protein